MKEQHVDKHEKEARQEHYGKARFPSLRTAPQFDAGPARSSLLVQRCMGLRGAGHIQAHFLFECAMATVAVGYLEKVESNTWPEALPPRPSAAEG